jgi:hypothetical protein
MRLSTLLSKHLTDAVNIQKSNSVNYFNLCATIWMVRIFEGTPALSRVLSIFSIDLVQGNTAVQVPGFFC